jgi:hypothetical protein
MLSILRKLDNRIFFIMIPLILASFTHLWNVAQFPSFHPDEGVYIRRALHILAGQGLQDPSSRYDHSQDSTSAYDHPYFGPMFLAGIFKILGYPQILNTTPDVTSIETLSSVPRIIMGVLAVLDTFLVFRISERRYNSKVALFASVLFAVMPLSWYTRRVVLDSIMLPFLLTSILLILEIRSNPKYVQTLSILSGICFGLAIFTKIPSSILIPLIAYLIYQNIDKIKFPSVGRLKILTIWLIPVILIPTIWPVYAFISGDLDAWIDGIFWQSLGRQNKGKSLFDIAISAWESDPVLLILGAAGMIYLTIRRDYFPIIWIIPHITFLFFVGWVTHFHLILIIPILCISIAKMIYDLPAILPIKKNIPISTIIISGISLFGLISSSILISTNLSYVQFAATAYISNALVPNNGSFIIKNHTNINLTYTNHDDIDQITVISSPIFSWVYKYVFNHDNTFAHVRDTQPIKTEKLILLVDSTYKHVIEGEEGENATQLKRLMNIYNNSEIVALFKDDPSNYNEKYYPYTGIDSANIGSKTQEIRSNY